MEHEQENPGLYSGSLPTYHLFTRFEQVMKFPRDFGPYRLLKQIAMGGMAEIVLAKTKGLGGFEKLLALKMIHPKFSSDKHFINMLIEEAKICVALDHANIGQVFDLGKLGDTYFISMEYIEGADIFRMMRRATEFDYEIPIETCAHIGLEICTGLDYAHTRVDKEGNPISIVHRDISPQNVLISYAGEVKIVDFGIAKAGLRAQQTEIGVIKGKYYYMSPEQAWGDPVDHRSDIFSTGIIIYEMLAGQMLYLEEKVEDLVDRVRKADIVPPSTLRREIPPEFESIVMKALAKHPSDRFDSAHEMAQDLRIFLYNYSPDYTSARLASMLAWLFDEDSHSALREVHRGPSESFMMTKEDISHSLSGQGSLLFDVADFEHETRSIDIIEKNGSISVSNPALSDSGDLDVFDQTRQVPFPNMYLETSAEIERESESVEASMRIDHTLDLLNLTPVGSGEWDDESDTTSVDNSIEIIQIIREASPKHGSTPRQQSRQANEVTQKIQPEHIASSLQSDVREARKSSRLPPPPPPANRESSVPPSSYIPPSPPSPCPREESVHGDEESPPDTDDNREHKIERSGSSPRHRGEPSAEPSSKTSSLPPGEPGPTADRSRSTPVISTPTPPAKTEHEKQNESAESSTSNIVDADIHELNAPSENDTKQTTFTPEDFEPAFQDSEETGPTDISGIPSSIISEGLANDKFAQIDENEETTDPTSALPQDQLSDSPTQKESDAYDQQSPSDDDQVHHEEQLLGTTPTRQMNGPPLGIRNGNIISESSGGTSLEPGDVIDDRLHDRPPETEDIAAVRSHLNPLKIIRRKWKLLLPLVAASAIVPFIILVWPEPTSFTTLDIRSHPPGAQVYLDGVLQQKQTPTEIPNLKMGEVHQVELRLDGFTPWNQSVELNAKRIRQIAVLSPIRGTLRVTSEPLGASVIIDGVYRGSTPHETETLNINRPVKVQVRFEEQTQVKILDWGGQTEASIHFRFKKQQKK